MSDKNKKGRKKDSVSSETAGEKLNGYEDKKLTEGADNELNASETASETKGEKLAEALGSAAYDENPPKNDDSNRILMEESADKPDSSADENGSELSADESRKTKNEENKSEFLTKTEKDEDSAFSEKEKTEKSSELSEKSEENRFSAYSPYDDKSENREFFGAAYGTKENATVRTPSAGDNGEKSTARTTNDGENKETVRIAAGGGSGEKAKTPIDANLSLGGKKSQNSHSNPTQTAKSNKQKYDGSSAFLWIVIVGVAALLIALALGSGNSLVNATATLKGAAETRLGQSVLFTADISESTSKFKADTDVVWTVNGKEVKKSKIGDKNALSYEFKPSEKGEKTVGVKVGDYGNLTKTKVVTVKNPLITVTMNDISMTYGDEIPNFTYKSSGYLNSDTSQSVKLSVKGSIPEKKPDAGSYPINATVGNLTDYDVTVKPGTLTVKPRSLRISSAISKVYDGKTDCGDCLKSPTFDNLVEGDDVSLSGKVSFSDKNAGSDKSLNFGGVKLSGKSAANYVLDTQSVTGTIIKKVLTLSELKAADKVFDGTDSVTFNSVGSLNGIVSGDKVAIGEITARFGDSAVGDNKTVIIDEILLVGADAANYSVDKDIKITANISSAAS